MYDSVFDEFDDEGNFLDSNFADPGGGSALRAATLDHCWRCNGKISKSDEFCKHCGFRLNPRKFPCPCCGSKQVLTPADKQRGYVCDPCADRAEGLRPEY